MMNDSYIRTAHRRAVFIEMAKLLRSTYMASAEKPEPTQILSEDATYAARVVSQEAIIDVLAMVEALEEREKRTLEKYELREREVLTLPEVPKPKETVDEKPVADVPAAGSRARKPRSA